MTALGYVTPSSFSAHHVIIVHSTLLLKATVRDAPCLHWHGLVAWALHAHTDTPERRWHWHSPDTHGHRDVLGKHGHRDAPRTPRRTGQTRTPRRTGQTRTPRRTGQTRTPRRTVPAKTDTETQQANTDTETQQANTDTETHRCLTASTETMRLIKDDWGGGGGGGYRGGGRGRLYTYRYPAVTTRMTPALRWVVMRAILMFH